MRKYIIYIILTISIFSKEKLEIGISEIAKDIPSVEIFKEAFSKSMDNLGYEVSFIYLPILRSIDEADRGKIDGDMPRSKETIKLYKNIFQVNVEIGRTKLYAYTTDDLKIGNFKDLEGKKIGVLLGAFNSEDILRKNLKKYGLSTLN